MKGTVTEEGTWAIVKKSHHGPERCMFSDDSAKIIIVVALPIVVDAQLGLSSGRCAILCGHHATPTSRRGPAQGAICKSSNRGAFFPRQPQQSLSSVAYPGTSGGACALGGLTPRRGIRRSPSRRQLVLPQQLPRRHGVWDGGSPGYDRRSGQRSGGVCPRGGQKLGPHPQLLSRHQHSPLPFLVTIHRLRCDVLSFVERHVDEKGALSTTVHSGDALK